MERRPARRDTQGEAAGGGAADDGPSLGWPAGIHGAPILAGEGGEKTGRAGGAASKAGELRGASDKAAAALAPVTTAGGHHLIVFFA